MLPFTSLRGFVQRPRSSVEVAAVSRSHPFPIVLKHACPRCCVLPWGQNPRNRHKFRTIMMTSCPELLLEDNRCQAFPAFINHKVCSCWRPTGSFPLSYGSDSALFRRLYQTWEDEIHEGLPLSIIPRVFFPRNGSDAAASRSHIPAIRM